MTNEYSIKKLESDISKFVSDRDWKQFHSPKNLAMALSVEVAEIMEIFQWLTPGSSYSTEFVDFKHLEEEIGDVMIYLTTLSKTFDINPIEAALKKMEINRKKYPIEIVRGKSDKYNSYNKNQK